MTIEITGLPQGVECPNCGAFPCRYTVLEGSNGVGKVRIRVDCIDCTLRDEIGENQTVMVINVSAVEDQPKNHS